MKESERRRRNIMIYGIDEPNCDTEQLSIAADADTVSKFITDELKVAGVKIAKCFRVGREKPETSEAVPGATAIKKSRPVKVIFENIQDKGKVCEVYWERKNKKERLSFGISNDFTKHENE